MTDEQHDWDGCLMCAVRALTEGRPKDWSALVKTPGETVTGVVLRMGNQPTFYSNEPVPFVDLWLGGVTRVRATGHSMTLREQLVAAEIQVGDTVTVRFDGEAKGAMKSGKQMAYKTWTVTVERGHH
jgi:hypothetical protein